MRTKGAETLGVTRGSLVWAMKREVPLTGIAPEISKDITVIVDADPVVENQGAFGGMKLQDGGVFQCTSGWAVQKLSNGVRGATGAGHCPGIDQVFHPVVNVVHVAVEQSCTSASGVTWGGTRPRKPRPTISTRTN